MLALSSIQGTVMQVAEAITAALEIETEIVDSRLRIIGGTGRYVKKIGSLEEEGNLEGEYLYAAILRSGREYVSMDVRGDANYNRKEGELAEISCPIQVENQIIGIIGLVAFTPEQQRKIAAKSGSYLNFVRRMSELIAGKLVESQSSSKLATMLESMPEGLVAAGPDGRIFACNLTCQELLGRKRESLLGEPLSDLFPGESFFRPDKDRVGQARNKEIAFGDRRFLFNSVSMPETGTMYLFQDMKDAALKASQLAHGGSGTTFDNILGFSAPMEDAKRRALQVSSTDSTVLITGESGTGKELFARAIHTASPRSGEPFISVNCGAIPDALLESELFGYEKGAFTGADAFGKPGKFEIAGKGTIFLDEIGDMPFHLQVKLLHVLQNRMVERIGGTRPVLIEARVIAATNKNLEEETARGAFREDLYFRLNVIPLHIPPLNQRGRDVEVLLQATLRRFNRLLFKEVSGFSRKALELLAGYPWPGNVRELENAVEYGVNMATGREILPENLPPRILRFNNADSQAGGGKSLPGKSLPGPGTLKEQTDQAQKEILASCLARTGSNLSGKREAARILGISESTLYRRLRELGL